MQFCTLQLANFSRYGHTMQTASREDTTTNAAKQQEMQIQQSDKKLHGCRTSYILASICLILLLCNVALFMKSQSYCAFDAALRVAKSDSVSTALTASGQEHCDTHVATAFEKIVLEANEMAFSEPATPPRKKFDLATWKKGTGGLTDEDRLLLAKIYENASSVFEFGLGESTLIASHVGVPRYAGIDSDAVWVSQSRDAVHSHFRFYLADIGITGLWGFPSNTTLPKSVLDYQVAPLIVEPHAFDVYMVDGRMRFACMMASFLHASSHGAPTDHTMVLNHDCKPTLEYAGKRESYKAADHLLDLVLHSGSKLCAYRRKPSTSDDDLLKLWQKYSTVWQR